MAEIKQIIVNDIAYNLKDETVRTNLNTITNLEDSSFNQLVFDMIYPIGVVYVQYPNCDSPNTLFSGYSTWTDITSDYAGLFFRAAGTVSGTNNASGSFNSSGVTVQNEGLPNITGSFRHNALADNEYTVTGAFTKSESDNKKWTGTSENTRKIGLVTFNAANSNSIYGSSSHVTPANTAIKIWKRTA